MANLVERVLHAGEGKRLKITAGHTDGADRTQVGFIEIK